MYRLLTAPHDNLEAVRYSRWFYAHQLPEQIKGLTREGGRVVIGILERD